ncbi:hypothetical protein SmJEL517_g02505 [Synchytrium microbalum]|uniref:HP domain-containing protein n=1 Tax=Synchytrium microbalum TaxID=1806994 RepID=A0A507C6E8_9FUNG|nr:uncharacterized protein SmJEL517_g02505 [Synchytrium microbalum]TPX35081.1 hypothetical protein SmJEL517_g02505 [Synchytrium microbalum]
MESKTLSKYRNVFATAPLRTLYTQVRIDATAPTKIKASERYFAIPFGAPGSNGHVGVLPMPGSNPITTKIETHPHILLAHNKPISDFEFSPLSPNILLTSTRNDGLVRIWQLPETPDDKLPVERVEITTPTMILAGHEKKVDLIKFHPSCGNIVSTVSADSTIRLWEIMSMTCRITCNVPASPTSLSWNYQGDEFVAMDSIAGVHLFDPRDGTAPVHSLASGLKGNSSKVVWLTPDPLIVTAGFTKSGNQRQLLLWDVRSFETPVMTLDVPGAGVSGVTPFWDPALPLLYLTAKGESIRIVELFEGSLRLSAADCKIERPLTAIDMLQKGMCTPLKCEIARFVRLGADNTIEITALNVPRVDGESVIQQDLYPPIAMVDPSHTAQAWFDSKLSLEPLMAEAFQTVAPISETLPVKRSATLRRAGTMSRKAKKGGTRSSQDGPSSLDCLTEDEDRDDGREDLDGHVKIDHRGWFGKLLLFEDADADSPIALFHVSKNLSALSQLSFTSNGPKIGLSLVLDNRTYRFQFANEGEASLWYKVLDAIIRPSPPQIERKTHSRQTSRNQNSLEIPRTSISDRPLSIAGRSSTGSNGSLKHLVMGSRTGILMMGELLVFSETDNQSKSKWNPRVVELDQDALLNIYTDMKHYTSNSIPIQSINLGAAISIRLTKYPLPSRNNTFAAPVTWQVNTKKRVIFFSALNNVEEALASWDAAKWVLETRKALLTKSIFPAAELVAEDVSIEGFAEFTTSLGEMMIYGRIFLSVVIEDIYIFDTPFSTTPVYCIASSKFQSISRVAEEAHSLEICIKDMHPARFRVASEKEMDMWMSLNFEAIDVLNRIGITGEQQYKDAIIQAKLDESETEVKESHLQNVHVVDEKLISSGRRSVLIGVFGKVKLVVTLVEPIWRSLRMDSSFTFDCGHEIYVWYGKDATRVSRAKAVDIAGKIRKFRNDRPKIHMVDSEEPDLSAKFFSKLACQDSWTNLFIDHTDPGFLRRCAAHPTRIYRIFDSRIRKRQVRLVETSASAPSKSVLEEGSVFIIEAWQQVYCWIGRGSSNEHRTSGWAVARKLAESLINPEIRWVGVAKITSGQEPEVLKEHFVGFEGTLPISMRLAEPPKGRVATTTPQQEIPLSSLMERKATDPELLECVDDGRSSTLSLFRVREGGAEPVSSEDYGTLYRDESYIILYKYRLYGGREQCLSYFWQGSASSIIEKGTSAMLASEMTKESGIEARHVRVIDGKEPLHFCRVFPSMTICRNREVTTKSLFEIIPCYGGKHFKAVEIQPADLVVEPGRAMLFKDLGLLCISPDAPTGIQEFSQTLASSLKIKSLQVLQQSDPRSGILDSWLKQKAVAAERWCLPTETRIFDARLWICSSSTGVVKVEEIRDFIQEDLERVAILESRSKVFIHFGLEARAQEKIFALETFSKYATHYAKPMVVTFAYQEPVEFTRHFPGWTHEKIPSHITTRTTRVEDAQSVLKEFKRDKFSLEILLSDPPEYLPKTKLEYHLYDDEFESMFGMTMVAYQKLPEWKRLRLKGDVGFF